MTTNGPSVVGQAHPAVSRWSVASWPLRWKVAAIMVLPVALASTFGGLRINAELSDASGLGIAASNVGVVTAAVDLAAQTSELAYAMAAGNVTEQQRTQFGATLSAYNARIQASDLNAAVTAELGTAAGTASAIWGKTSSGPANPASLPEEADAVTGAVSRAIAATMGTIRDDEVRRLTATLLSSLEAQRGLAIQRLLAGLSRTQDTVSLRARIAAAAGRESAALDQLKQLSPETANLSALLSAAEGRRAVYALPIGALTTHSGFADAIRTGSADYQKLASGIANELASAVADRATASRSAALRDTALVLGSVLAALIFALGIGGMLVRAIQRLRQGALQVARERLPEEIDRLSQGGGIPEIAAMPVHTREEIGQLARAIDDIHLQALTLASEHGVRLQIGEMFETLSRRSRSLVDEQLALIDTLERDEEDPVRLERLFRLDHLTTRMRRNGDNLLVLAGTVEQQRRLAPVKVSDVLRGAMSEVEDYRRVKVGSMTDSSVMGNAAADAGHLLAELIDNALRYSPPDTVVGVSVGRAVDGGILIEIADRGLGMPADELSDANENLSAGGEVTSETARRMGLFVVGRLAERHEATVRLRPTAAGADHPGVTASVHLPSSLVAPHEIGDDYQDFELVQRLPGSATATAATPLKVSVVQAPPAFPPPPSAAPAVVTLTSSGLPKRVPGAVIPAQSGPPVERGPAADGLDATQPGLPALLDDDDDDDEPVHALGQLPALPRRKGAAQAPDTAPPASGGTEQQSLLPGLPQRRPGGALQAETAQEGAPAQDPAQPAPAAASGLPQRAPGASGAVTAAPFGTVPDASPAPEGDAFTLNAFGEQPEVGGRRDAANTYGFFAGIRSHASADIADTIPGVLPDSLTAVPPVAAATAAAPEQDELSPIYQRLTSEWLMDPAAQSGAQPAWKTEADAGWTAAARASEVPAATRTESGLPIRERGARLVPGAAPQPGGGFTGPRGPAEFQSNISRQLAGARNGRARAEQFSDESAQPAGTTDSPDVPLAQAQPRPEGDQ